MLRQFQISGLGAILLLVSSMLVQISSVKAEDVQLEYNGIELKGFMEVAPGQSIINDGIVIIIHQTLSHAKSPLISDLQQGLKQQGINSLAINLSLGLDLREGDFQCAIEHNHRHKDGAEEIGAWVEWLAVQGANKISFFGLGRGGNQAALYVYEQIKLHKEEEEAKKKELARKKKRRRRKKRESPKIYLGLISKLIMVMPLDLSPEQAYKEFSVKFNDDLGKYLVNAQKFVEKQREQELLEGVPFLSCNPARVTVAAFIDYYLPKPEHSLFSYISDFSFPVLAVVGSEDPQYRKYEGIVSSQLEKGIGQLGVAKLSGINRNLEQIPSEILIQQVSGFLKR